MTDEWPENTLLQINQFPEDIEFDPETAVFEWKINLIFHDIIKLSTVVSKPHSGFDRKIQESLPRLQSLANTANTKEIKNHFGIFFQESPLFYDLLNFISLGFRPGARIAYGGLGLQLPKKRDLKFEERVNASMLDKLDKMCARGKVRKLLGLRSTGNRTLHPNFFTNIWKKKTKELNVKNEYLKPLDMIKTCHLRYSADKQWVPLDHAIARLSEALYWQTPAWSENTVRSSYSRFDFALLRNAFEQVGCLRKKLKTLRVRPSKYKRMLTKHAPHTVRLVRVLHGLELTSCHFVTAVLGGD
jgi:hypothetical protein